MWRRFIAEQTEATQFFAEEIVGDFVQRGVLSGQRSGWRLGSRCKMGR